ncbi:MAG TPA: TIGR03435 family protein [Bryobacteraceae bacterium]|nr:TIGR03435 family protein [Bryobacteraceae bacterium]
MRRSVLVVLAAAVLGAQPANFEAASLKRVEPGGMERLAAAERSGQDTGVKVGWWGGPGSGDPEGFTAQYVSLARLISRAYDLKPYQFSPPEWMGIERYNLIAKVTPGATEAQFRRMLQNLLAERLDLKVHWETKEMPVYELVTGKGGPKFEGADGKPEGYPKLTPGGEPALAVERGRAVRRAHGETMEETAAFLSAYLRRPVIDATGLTGKYDFILYWVQNPAMLPADAETGPGLAEAVQEQLGLKLEPKERGAVPVLVVEHAEKIPREN